jgi:glycosyltransferase involved in cell wall biosynthesis
MQNPFDICHLTTVHSRNDIRIRVKQVLSLSKMLDTEVCLFVQDGLGDETDPTANVRVFDTGKPFGRRLLRMTVGAFRMWRALRAVRPRVVHFHDPELIPVGLGLKLIGTKVIYDVHEDLPRQIMSKSWLPGIFRRPTAWAMEFVEWAAARSFDAIVTATPKIAERFPHEKTVVVQNFPLLEELIVSNPTPLDKRSPAFAYVGGITIARGAQEMIEAFGLVPKRLGCRLELAGKFIPRRLMEDLKKTTGWNRVRFHGWTTRTEVAKILGEVRGGLVLYHPLQNHIDAQPNKMFEYMAARLPVIASDFPLWREIVEGAQCGLLVNPLEPHKISGALQWILDHPEEANEMGKRGRRAVEKIYNWEKEKKKLLALYEDLK